MKEYNPKERLIVYKIVIAVQAFALICALVFSEDSKKVKETAQAPINTAWESKPQKSPSTAWESKPQKSPSNSGKFVNYANTNAKPMKEPINSFIDYRDNQEYKATKIGNQIWMAENLNYVTNGSRCYDEDQNNCDEYGRMYSWAAAMKVCPSGWHLPTKAEWDILTNAVGGAKVAGRHLKATSGWNDFNDEPGTGSDTYGFAALPGGSHIGKFHLLGSNGYWWSASENGDGSTAYYRFMLSENNETGWNNKTKSLLLSVRCLQD